MLHTSGERLWDSLMAMAEIGATDGGGSSRLALGAADADGRRLFETWCRDAGLSITRDAIGNTFARRPGRDDVAPVLLGSHLDTQPRGGRFDGVYGVLAALEAIRTLDEHDVTTVAPLEIVNWTNEEGARFTPAMLGSAVFTGAMPLAEGLARKDAAGESVAESLRRTNLAGDAPLGRAVNAYFEAHIEQGPVLETRESPIGVVTGGQAIRWLDVHLTGRSAHAGTTPMAVRRDPVFAAGAIVTCLESEVAAVTGACATIGEFHIPHGSRNTIAGAVSFTLDLRHPEDAALDALTAGLERRFAAICERRGVAFCMTAHWRSPALPFDTACIDRVRDAAEGLDIAYHEMISGAGHDAFHLARHCPTAMIFIPCAGGVSHHESESIEPEHACLGADVLLNSVLARAERA